MKKWRTFLKDLWCSMYLIAKIELVMFAALSLTLLIFSLFLGITGTEIGSQYFLFLSISMGLTFFLFLIMEIKKFSGFNDESGTAGIIKKLLAQKSENLFYSIFYLVCSIVAEMMYMITGTISFIFQFSMWVPALTFALILLCLIVQQIQSYRVRKGLYGTCEHEAREIIAFIMEEQKRGGNGGGKLVFPKEELDALTVRDTGGEAHA